MEHTANHIYGVVGGLEFLVQLNVCAVGILNLNIVPGVNVYLLNACPENVFCKEREFRHFCVKLVYKLGLGHSLNGNPVVQQVLSDVPLDLIFHLVIAGIYIVYAVDHQRRILARNVGLHLVQHVGEFPILFGFEEQILRCGISCKAHSINTSFAIFDTAFRKSLLFLSVSAPNRFPARNC